MPKPLTADQLIEELLLLDPDTPIVIHRSPEDFDVVQDVMYVDSVVGVDGSGVLRFWPTGRIDIPWEDDDA